MSVIVPKRTINDLMEEEVYRNDSLFNFNQQQKKIFNDYSDPNQLNYIQPNKLLLNQQVNDTLTNFGLKFKDSILNGSNSRSNTANGPAGHNNVKNGRMAPPKRKLKTLTPIGKFDDFLFNPNIEPSSSINFNYNNFNYDDSILIHHDNMEILNDLHNYVDEDLSDFDEDEEDDEEDDDENDGIDENDIHDFIGDDLNYTDIPNVNTISASSDSLDKKYFDDINLYNYKEFDAQDSTVNINMTDVDINDVSMDELDINDVTNDDINDVNIAVTDVNMNDINDVNMNDINDYNDDALSLNSIDDLEMVDDDLHMTKPLSNRNHDEAVIEKKKNKEVKKEVDEIEVDKNMENDHICMLINPNTGHQCQKQFSRPYDLIRHQETIHASLKKIFRCVICEGRLDGGKGNGKSKTFSRGDALSRHIKVKHQLVGKDALDLINSAKDNVEYVSVNS